MRRLSRPIKQRNGISWEHHTPEALARLREYCRQDVRCMRALVRALPAWAVEVSALERWAEGWTVRANSTGVTIDGGLFGEIADSLAKVEDAVPAEYRSPAWVRQELEKHGVNIPDASEQTIEELLQHENEAVRFIARMRLLASRAAVRKLIAIDRRVFLDGRLRGILRYYGAHTGRWAGEGVQLQNFPRDSTASDAEVTEERRRLESSDPAVVTEAATKLLRPLVVAPPDHVLIRADFSQIEARVLLLLACARTPSKADLLKEFLKSDAYRLFASRIFQKPAEEISKAERQIGKAAVLGLGYGMGAPRFQRTVKALCGQDIALEEAQRIVQLYRQVYSPIPAFWSACAAAANKALQQDGLCVMLNLRLPRDIFFAKDGDWLVIRLPSDRFLAYYKAERREEEGIVAPYGPRGPMRLYGGMITENIVQAVARDILVQAMKRIEERGWRVAFTVHDEIVVEAPAAKLEECQRDVTECMTEAPPWLFGPGLSWIGGDTKLLGAELACGRHYGK